MRGDVVVVVILPRARHARAHNVQHLVQGVGCGVQGSGCRQCCCGALVAHPRTPKLKTKTRISFPHLSLAPAHPRPLNAHTARSKECGLAPEHAHTHAHAHTHTHTYTCVHTALSKRADLLPNGGDASGSIHVTHTSRTYTCVLIMRGALHMHTCRHLASGSIHVTHT